ncbi:Hypothetical protein R9X50_00757700 [Acrodontium crateriforme]|uniref:DNA polymerase delta subunit 4 n=1 Tax=Acrodontium crateriforme TaxID=150365 RepID=A0AAQ3MAC9_9PEZI|nr:Hypothetical protein R9X50_00757700 [Acrodontium crateriforme]
MPPKRRSTGPRTAAASQQSTLSFHGKTNKITKASVQQDAKALKKDLPAPIEVTPIDLTTSSQPEVEATEIEEPKVEDAGVEQTTEREIDPLESVASKTEDVLGGRAEQSEVGAVGGKSSGWIGEEEEEARKITETQIKNYWRQKEAERLAPRIHQGDLDVYEKVLREWDMSGQFGPCIGIARLKRWKRANMLGLHPPIEVLAVLLREIDGGATNVNKAHVDVLMGSRFAEIQ